MEKTMKDKIKPMGVLEKTRIVKGRLNLGSFGKN
jgi:hypothetical protein